MRGRSMLGVACLLVGCASRDGATSNGGGGEADGGATVADASPSGAAAKVLLTITLHLENSTFDASYFAALDDFAKTFETYGGRLTFEPRDEVVIASTGLLDWKTLESRGHSVGSHAAIGGTASIPLAQFTAQAKMRYDRLSPKVDRLDHISGNCGNVDWVGGVVDAGFRAATAATALCFYGMPAESRPAPYQDLQCSGATDPACHAPYPSELAQRIHPWRASSSATWLTDDPAGKLVILPGSGSLPCLEEEATSSGASLPTCTFTDEDVVRALADLDAAIALADPDKVNTFYWVWGSWSLAAAEKPILDSFLKAIEERAKAGKVEWASTAMMLDAYATWEKTHR